MAGYKHQLWIASWRLNGTLIILHL